MTDLIQLSTLSAHHGHQPAFRLVDDDTADLFAMRNDDGKRRVTKLGSATRGADGLWRRTRGDEAFSTPMLHACTALYAKLFPDLYAADRGLVTQRRESNGKAVATP